MTDSFRDADQAAAASSPSREEAAAAAVPFDGTEPAPAAEPERTAGAPPAPQTNDEAAGIQATDPRPSGDGEVAGDLSDPVADALSAALSDAERARDEYLDHLRRERAEFENFRRRSTKERMDALDRGAEQVVSSLLGVLDNFGLALGAAGQRDTGDPLAKGVQMVHSELRTVLRNAGLEEVPGEGAVFDPTHHEAVAQVDGDASAGSEAGPAEPVVVEVLRPGYRFKGRVLRPASVKVAR